MAISFYLKLNSKNINKEIIAKELNYLFPDVQMEMVQETKKRTFYTGYYENIGFSLSFVVFEAQTYQYDDSDFLEKEFKYNQMISFSFNKFGEFNYQCKNAFFLIFRLLKIYHPEALLSSDFTNDILYFIPNKKLIINSCISFTNPEVLEIPEDFEVEYI